MFRKFLAGISMCYVLLRQQCLVIRNDMSNSEKRQCEDGGDDALVIDILAWFILLRSTQYSKR